MLLQIRCVSNIFLSWKTTISKNFHYISKYDGKESDWIDRMIKNEIENCNKSVEYLSQKTNILK